MQRMRGYLLIGGISGILVVSGLSGCSWYRNREARESGRPAMQVADDDQINHNVASALKRAPVYKFPDVGVKTLDRVVQLNGFVATDAQKQAAQEIAQKVPGVTRVINSIEVQSPVLSPTGRTNSPNPSVSR